MSIITQYPSVVAFICAELFFLIARSSEITIALKKENQRTEEEKSKIKNGLKRSLFFEAFLFVPASVTLFLCAVFPLISDTFQQVSSEKRWYGLVGIVAYGFPFLTVRQIITRIALATLREFAAIADSSDE